MFEEVLKALVLPCGVIWLLLMASLYIARRYRQVGSFRAILLMLIIYSVVGNTWIGNRLLVALEGDYRTIEPKQEGTFEAVFVLGGGTRLSPTHTPQLGQAGDRVMTAARLYHNKQVDYIVCTGQEARHSPANHAASILRDVGVPGERILELGGGNTCEELALAAETIELRGWKRVGLITSAWHLKRAMKQAAIHDLDLQPLPADFRGSKSPWRWVYMIPTSNAMEDNRIFCNELIGALVGR